MDIEGNKQFQSLVAKGNPVGEVFAVDKFLVKVRGLHPTTVHALVMFIDGSKGFVHHIFEDYVMIMHLGDMPVPVGSQVVVQHPKLVTKVGKNYIGRVVSVTGEPLDGKGPISADGSWPVFNNAPMIYERELVDTQLETGILVLDTLFSVVRGQRMAILGDGKSGKSTLTSQIAINQRDTDITVIYCLIAKRRSDVKTLVTQLEENGALDKAIVVVSTMFESLVINYLAPYVAASLGEYLWQYCNMDTLIIYDDLTSHAQAHREISLIAGVSPGRDSYPGDVFYTHSQLVERAGKIERNHKAQTVLPIVYAPAGDISAYLPTNVMSMTDGQWILDMRIFRDTMRPAISTGLSVTRVGGVGQNKRQKALGSLVSKALAAFHAADEYAHFGSELSASAKNDINTGKMLFEAMNQVPGETYNLMAQQLILDIILNRPEGETLDIKKLKANANEFSAKVVENSDEDTNFDQIRDELHEMCIIEHAPKPVEEKQEVEVDSTKDDKKGKKAKEPKKKKEKKEEPVKKPDEPKEKPAPEPETKESPAPAPEPEPAKPVEPEEEKVFGLVAGDVITPQSEKLNPTSQPDQSSQVAQQPTPVEQQVAGAPIAEPMSQLAGVNSSPAVPTEPTQHPEAQAVVPDLVSVANEVNNMPMNPSTNEENQPEIVSADGTIINQPTTPVAPVQPPQPVAVAPNANESNGGTPQ